MFKVLPTFTGSALNSPRAFIVEVKAGPVSSVNTIITPASFAAPASLKNNRAGAFSFFSVQARDAFDNDLSSFVPTLANEIAIVQPTGSFVVTPDLEVLDMTNGLHQVQWRSRVSMSHSVSSKIESIAIKTCAEIPQLTAVVVPAPSLLRLVRCRAPDSVCLLLVAQPRQVKILPESVLLSTLLYCTVEYDTFQVQLHYIYYDYCSLQYTTYSSILYTMLSR